MGHHTIIQCHPPHSYVSIANSFSSSSSSNGRGNCSSNTEFHMLLELHLGRLLRFSKDTASTRRGLKNLNLTLKAEQRRLNRQTALPGVANEEKAALLMSKEPSASSSIVPVAAPPLSHAMYAAQSSNPRTVSISRRTDPVQNPLSRPPSSLSRQQCHNNTICPCAGGCSSKNLPRKVSFADQAEMDAEIDLPLFDNEFIISEDDSSFLDDDDDDLDLNSPHVEMFQLQFFPLDV